jgi:hypothetical protein
MAWRARPPQRRARRSAVPFAATNFRPILTQEGYQSTEASVANTIKELTVPSRRLGAPDPEGWARSQLTEGITQLHRYLFLRQA